LLVLLAATVHARPSPEDAQAKRTAKRIAMEKELRDIAIIDRRVMIPMRDGKRMMADIYIPRHTKAKVPVILRRTPYNYDFWDVKRHAPQDMSVEIDVIKHGYAYAVISERGHYYSEGEYDILGPPLTDGSDEIDWLASQPWSNGKVGLTGCSSSAEWQLAVASRNDAGLGAFNVQSFGAGVGRVGPYYEQGNWFRGGAMRMAFIPWLFDEQNTLRPMFPPGTSQADLVRAAKMFDLEPSLPEVDWDKALWHLPVSDIIRHVGGPPGIFATTMPVATGGNMIARTPNDPAWYRGGLWHDDMSIAKPGLWYMSWYDFSVSPNLAAYNAVRRDAPKPAADQQYAVIGPVLHCAYARSSEHTKVGELDVGDARFDYNGFMFGWFDHFLKGEDNGALRTQPKVLYYVMGRNVWKKSATWPPSGATTRTFFLASNGHANTLHGDGHLDAQPGAHDAPDNFIYDPAHPVLTHGGCCMGPPSNFGALDQTPFESRKDVLIYQTPAFDHGFEASGPISMTLYVSSDARDTDFTFKVIDVYPDGKAYNLTENIQRMRWREGYDKPPVWMHKGKVYKVTFQPIDISNEFLPGHRLRIEISSSNFPRFDRNLNTGGNNEEDSRWVVAHNTIHHDVSRPSSITFTVVPAVVGPEVR
jgi:putative CocE/NonD family hydrolase